jgi:flagellar motor switch/type III secretory pathway protein FliN
MSEYDYEDEEEGQPSVAIKRAPEQDISFWATRFFLVVGIFPLAMLFQYWFRSGTGLNPLLVGFALCGLASLAMAVNYYLYYSQHKPRSAIVAPNLWKCLLVAGILLPVGAYNMIATPRGMGMMLSPGPKIESSQWPRIVANVLGAALSPGSVKDLELPPRKRLDIKRNQWMLARPYMGGGLWGALGYAIPFAFMGCLFGLMRKEVLDPRDEHIGSTAGAALVRGAVGLYYGMAIGFALGGSLIFVIRLIFPKLSAATPDAIMHVVYTLGAASNPNVAFVYALSTGCMLAGAFALFGGKPDLTAPLSDPKAPELTRPIDVQIPEVPDAPQMGFDMGRVQAESQQLLSQFQGQLHRMFEGPEWDYEAYDLPPVGKHGKKPEPEATNLISAREPGDMDDDAPSAMGSLSNVYVQITAELGKLEVPAADWLGLAEGAILELPKSPDGTVAITINGKPAGRGRPLTVNGNKAVKMVGLRGKLDHLVKS